MPNIDPAKTAKADETYVKLGAQSLDMVAQNFSGTRYKQNRAKLERQYEGHPMPPWEKKQEAAAPGAPSGVSDDDNDDDEENGGQ